MMWHFVQNILIVFPKSPRCLPTQTELNKNSVHVFYYCCTSFVVNSWLIWILLLQFSFYLLCSNLKIVVVAHLILLYFVIVIVVVFFCCYFQTVVNLCYCYFLYLLFFSFYFLNQLWKYLLLHFISIPYFFQLLHELFLLL